MSLIKVDVEGFEEQVLLGGKNTIAKSNPIIYLEADRSEKLESLSKVLGELGYMHVPHNPPLFNPNNYFNNKKNIWGTNYVSFNWECRPIKK